MAVLKFIALIIIAIVCLCCAYAIRKYENDNDF